MLVINHQQTELAVKLMILHPKSIDSACKA